MRVVDSLCPVPTMLTAKHVYCPASDVVISSNVNDGSVIVAPYMPGVSDVIFITLLLDMCCQYIYLCFCEDKIIQCRVILCPYVALYSKLGILTIGTPVNME